LSDEDYFIFNRVVHKKTSFVKLAGVTPVWQGIPLPTSQNSFYSVTSFSPLPRLAHCIGGRFVVPFLSSLTLSKRTRLRN